MARGRDGAPYIVDVLEQVAARADLHDEVVLARRTNPCVQPHDVLVAQPLVVLHLPLKQNLGTLLQAVALDDFDRHLVAGRGVRREADCGEPIICAIRISAYEFRARVGVGGIRSFSASGAFAAAGGWDVGF